jgi:drug/metabolite transporter (DMT)-like permease
MGFGVKWFLHPSRFWIFVWFCLNVSLTLLNKAAMEFIQFEFPCAISLVHMTVSTILGWFGANVIGINYLSEKHQEIDPGPQFEKTVFKRILMLSFLFTLNIAFGNISLRYCSVAFVQVVRAIIPMTTLGLSMIFLGSSFSVLEALACLVVCVGVGFSCFGEIDLTRIGLIVTVIGCVLSAGKSVSVKALLGDLHSFDLLHRMTPLAGMEMFVLVIGTGEYSHIPEKNWGIGAILLVLLTGVFAFTLNLTNFMATSHTSPLTVTIVGCIKQIVTIGLSVFIFDKRLTLLNWTGIVVTTIGGLWYSLLKRKKPSRTPLLPRAL